MKRLVPMVTLLLSLAFCVSCGVPLHQINGADRTGDVVIHCAPADAKVYLDGNYVGKARQFAKPDSPLRVTVGVHVIEFEREDYQRELREVMTTTERTTLSLTMQLRPQPPEEDTEE